MIKNAKRIYLDPEALEGEAFPSGFTVVLLLAPLFNSNSLHLHRGAST